MFKNLPAIGEALRGANFITRFYSVLTNPSYILRHGLFKTISHIAPQLKGKILDFGCGSKPYESLFINADQYFGVDVETSGHLHENSKVDLYFDGKVLPLGSQTFDAVVAFEVFEHIFDPQASLEEIKRVLKPGGALLISVPFAWDEHEIPFDFARYTSYGIRHILEEAGFTVDRVTKTTTYVLAVSQLWINYFAEHVFSKRLIIRGLTQLLLIFPLTVISLIVNLFLPKRYGYFSNSVVLAKKPS